MVVFDSTLLPAQSNTSCQPILPRPTQPVSHGEKQEHGTQNVFRVEPPKRKKANRKKKDNHEEEPQLIEIGSMVIGPTGPSFALLPSLQSNSCPRSGTRECQNSTVESTTSQPRDSSSRPQTERGAGSLEQRVRTFDLTRLERQSRGSSQSVLPCPPTSDGSLSVRSMVLGPMGPSIAVLPSLKLNSRSQRNGAQTREQRVMAIDLTRPGPQSWGANSQPLPLRPQEQDSGSREQRVRTAVPTEPRPQSRYSSRLMPSRLQAEQGVETQERQIRIVHTSEAQSRDSSLRSLPSHPQIEISAKIHDQRVRTVTSTRPQSRSFSRSMPPRPRTEHGAETRERVRTANPTEHEPQPQGSFSQPPPPRPPMNDVNLEKYVSRCWDAGCTSCRSYSLYPQ